MSVRAMDLVRIALMLALTVSAGGNSSAQVRRGEGIPKALENVKPAMGICRRGDVAGNEHGQGGSPEIERDLSCAMLAVDLRQFMADPSAQIVDLRAPADFQLAHIEGAMNLGEAELLAKPYWRSKPVALVGDGKAEVELYRTCARLKLAGYRQIRVLRGGMPMWQMYDWPIAGRAPAAIQLAQLSAMEVWAESRNGDNVLLLDPELAPMRAELPTAVVLLQSGLPGIRVALERYKKERHKALPGAVVWMTSAAPEQIGQVQDAVKPVPLLVYRGGREALQRQVEVQQAVWSAQARGPKQPGCGL